MYKERLQEEISALIEKIKMDWGRIKNFSPGIHKIDKDIITGDIRRLYDLIYEIDFENSSTKISRIQVSLPSQKTQEKNRTDDVPDIQAPNPYSEPALSTNKISADEAPTEKNDTEMAVIMHDREDVVKQFVDPAFDNLQKENELLFEHEKTATHSEQIAKNIRQTQSNQQTKSTLDLFTAPKTLADIFQDRSDNSLSARMQHNPVADIKSAIGINEKFLFINTIFGGEISNYNKAIDQLNQLSDYYLALLFVDELRTNYEKENNKESFTKLMEIVKRKFQ